MPAGRCGIRSHWSSPPSRRCGWVVRSACVARLLPLDAMLKKENALYAGISETEKVDTFMDALKHPLHDVAEGLRKIILGTDKSIGEGIFWNAPTFYYTGELKPFDPKTYKRYLVG